MNHLPIIPLAGGLSMGADNVLNKYPDKILSFSPFEYNDQHYINHLNKRDCNPEYIVLDEGDYNVDNINNVNIVTALPPCAGLSMLNSSSGGEKSRGGNAKQNDWMYNSAEFVLENIKPDVLMGENAPNLFTKSGELVQKNMYKIARKYNYSLSFIKTNNYIHGTPQRRRRTFYFFWKFGNKVPFYNWTEATDTPSLSRFLDQVPDNALYHDVEEQKKRYYDNPYVKFFTHEYGDEFRNIVEEDPKWNALKYLQEHEMMEQISEWLIENGDNDHDVKTGKSIARKYEKVKDGKGYWNTSPMIYQKATNAIISKNRHSLIHPSKDRFITLREQMHLMKLPHDYELIDTEKTNVICQNVIVDTAEHFVKFAKDALEGKTDFIEETLFKQHNMSNKIVDCSDLKLESKKLF